MWISIVYRSMLREYQVVEPDACLNLRSVTGMS